LAKISLSTDSEIFVAKQSVNDFFVNRLGERKICRQISVLLQNIDVAGEAR